MDLVMETMDMLFEAYNVDFDRLEQDVRRLNRRLGVADVNKMWAKRLTREQFDNYLSASTPPSAAKRLLIEKLLHGRDHLLPSLPKHLATLLSTPPLAAPSQRQSVA